MTDDIDWQLLHRHLAGICTPVETVTVERWLAADPSREGLLESLRDITGRLAEPNAPPVAWDAEATWQRVAVRMRTQERPAARQPIAFPPSFSRSRWPLRAAAAIVVMAGGALTWLAMQSKPVASSAAVAAKTYTTPAGKRAEFRLPDGTRVTLSVASTLRLAPNYGAGARDVELDGEAYFDVVHDGSRPFAVHTRSAVARDIGTRFVVRAYGAETPTQVVVAEGEVGVRGTGSAVEREVVLAPGQLGDIDAAGDVAVRRNVDVERYTAWTAGTLVFKDTPLDEALAQIGRWYDLDVRLAGSRADTRRVTGSYRDDPVEQVLDHIALALNLRYERHGRTVTFGPK